jgi:hypothetical protein
MAQLLQEEEEEGGGGEEEEDMKCVLIFPITFI